MHQLAVLNLFLSWSDPQMLGWSERSRALQTLFLSKDGESCFPKLLLHATTRPNLTPFCCPSYAKHTIFYYWYFSQTTKIQKFDTQENTSISLCQALGQCQWVRKVSKQWVSDEWAKKKNRHLINKHHSLLTDLAYQNEVLKNTAYRLHLHVSFSLPAPLCFAHNFPG